MTGAISTPLAAGAASTPGRDPRRGAGSRGSFFAACRGGLGLAFALLIGLVAGVGAVGLRQMERVNANLGRVGGHQFAKLKLAREAVKYSALNNRITMQVFLLRDRDTIEPLLAERAANTAKITELITQIEKLVQTGREKAALNAVIAARAPYVASYEWALQLLNEDNGADAARKVMVETTIPALIHYHAAWDDFAEYQNAATDRVVQQSAEDYRAARDKVRSLIAGALLCAAVIAVFSTWKLAREIDTRRGAENALRRAHGELELRVQGRTAELAGANLRLESEIGERTRADRALQEINGQLEERVSARTAQLETANAKLEAFSDSVSHDLRAQARLLDLAHDAILVRDMAHRVQYWNEGAERLYGWSAAEAMGRDVRDLIRPAPEEFAEAMEALLEKGEWTDEQKHLHKGDRSIVVLSRGTLVRDEAGEPKSVLVINTDITERKKLESQFLRAQRMESIGTLASGVAHDLNNILAPILMSATLLRRELAVHMRESLISTIVTCAERGGDIVRQVLTFARSTTGERALLQPRHLLREIQNIITETFPKNIAIEDRVVSELWTVLGDATQIHQVLLNLCVNARDAMPGGGTLLLSAENFDLDENYASTLPGARPGRFVLVKVSDSGTGIRADVIDQIFDPFFTTKEHGEGTGLGLSTVAGIVKSHGGFIGVYSEVGRGTTFRVFLPAADAAPARDVATPDAPAPGGHGELVLVVDDEESIRKITGTVLTRHGYQVIVAADGADALAAFVKTTAPIKAVITDIMMPFIDGIALIRALHTLDPGVKIIATTGYAGEARIGELRAEHSGPCLAKPFKTALLLTTLHELLAAPDKA